MDYGVIAGIVLAAGRSVRMGRPKLLLPLEDGRSILAHVIGLLRQGGAEPLLTVTMEDPDVAAEVERLGAQIVLVVEPASGQMLESLQLGLTALQDLPAEAALIHPGDMPFVLPATVRSILDLWTLERPPILAPSFQNRRGHPVCLARGTWPDVLALRPPATLRDYLRRQRDAVRYIVVDDRGVIEDVDLPEDYDRAARRDLT